MSDSESALRATYENIVGAWTLAHPPTADEMMERICERWGDLTTERDTLRQDKPTAESMLAKMGDEAEVFNRKYVELAAAADDMNEALKPVLDDGDASEADWNRVYAARALLQERSTIPLQARERALREAVEFLRSFWDPTGYIPRRVAEAYAKGENFVSDRKPTKEETERAQAQLKTWKRLDEIDALLAEKVTP